MRSPLFAIVFLLFIEAGHLSAQAQWASPHVVKIIVTKQEHDQYSPWRKRGVQKVPMNGCLLEGNRILTSAHSLADAVQVEAMKMGDSKKYQADIVVRDYQSGIGIISVKDESYFSDLSGVPLCESQPLIGKHCTVCRWDAEGAFREYRADVISTSLRMYKPNNAVLMHTMSTDMEAGGFGEPVFFDKRLAGISTGFDTGKKNILVIGVDSIRRHMTDMNDGIYDGMPFFWIDGIPLESDVNLREYLGLGDADTGVYVDRIHSLSSGSDQILPGDVILNINNTVIEDTGLYRSPHYEKLNFYGLMYLNHFVNDTVEMTVFRNRRRVPLRFRLRSVENDRLKIPLVSYDSPPEYGIVGGCIFQHLTIGYMKTWGSAWEKVADRRILHIYGSTVMEPYCKGDRVVILNRVLPASVNSGYQGQNNLVLESLNGKPVKNIAGLKKAVLESSERFLKFDFAGRTSVVLDRREAARCEAQVLSTYQIPSAWRIAD